MEPGSKAPGDGTEGDMDDILASIRRILHSDEAEASASDAAELPAEEVIDLHRSMRVDPEPAPVHPAAAEPEADLHQPQIAETVLSQAAGPSDLPAEPLLGEGPASESAASLATLRAALAAQHPPAAEPSASVYRSGGLTIEDVVRDEVRELLRTWLDVHLPPMVERMVRAEIARISGTS